VLHALLNDGFEERLITSVKLDTNHGAFTWLKSDLDHAIHIGMGEEVKKSGDYTNVVRDATNLVDMFDLPREPMVTTFSRTGPIRKPQFIRGWGPNGTLHRLGQTLGRYPRRRPVRGVMAWYNEAIRSHIEGATDTLKRNDPFTFKHSTPEQTLAKLVKAVRAVGPGWRILSDDISGFDDSTYQAHQRTLYTRVWTFLGKLRDMVVASITFPQLTGPYQIGFRASVVPRAGGILSGTIFTTLEGNSHNFLRVLHSVAAAMNVSIEQAAATRNRDWFVMIQGDDTLLIVPPSFDGGKYEERSASLGFVSELRSEPVFLMTWYDLMQGRWHNLAMRALMRTATRERPAAGPATEAFAAAVRWAKCAHDSTYRVCFEALIPNPLFDRFNVRTPEDLRKLIMRDGFAELMEQEISAAQGVSRWANLLESLVPGGQRGGEVVPDLGAFAGVVNRVGGLRALLNTRESPSDLFARVVAKIGSAPDWRKMLAFQVEQQEDRSR
jgi:hypothetical protein